MDFAQMQFVFAGIGIVLAVIATVLWFIVFAFTKHKGGWFLVPLLPLVGILVVPFALRAALELGLLEGGNGMAFTATSMVLGFLFSVAPLFILALRLLNRQIHVVEAEDVFDER